MSAPLEPQPVLKLVDPGLLATIQDGGRNGWRRFGVPSSGAMDNHAAAGANALVGNPPNAPVLELLLQGARLSVMNDVRLAVTGANAGANLPMWEAVELAQGQTILLPRNHSGVWTYIAVSGGFHCEQVPGSASAYTRGGIGRALAAGENLSSVCSAHKPPSTPVQRRDYLIPPPLRVWPGPQWESFTKSDRDAFFARRWIVSSQSDRVGYRLTGQPLGSIGKQLLSEPMLPGTIQVPESGLPIVTMRDGPTVGGYAKLGLIDPDDLAWLAQCRPGQAVRFRLLQSES